MTVHATRGEVEGLDSVDSTTWIREFTGLATCRPGEEAPKPHGVGGDLAELIADLDGAALRELVLRSYDPAGPAEPHDADQVERESRGQARTVLRRLGGELVAALAAVI